MNRLIEYTVFSGLTIACRLATWPTRISPVLPNATTDGQRLPPSVVGITVALPPCTTATTEFVVPRSIPNIFAILRPPYSTIHVPYRPQSSLLPPARIAEQPRTEMRRRCQC